MRPWAGSRHSICSSVSARRHGVHPAQPGVGSGYHLRPDGPGFFLRRGRSKEVVDEVLGESFGGILVSDFYASYDHYPGLKQRCWAHLLRDIHKLKVLYPEDGGLTQWADPVGIGCATALRQRPGMGGGRGTPSVPRTVGAGGPVAGAVPSIPGRPVGGANQALPAD